MISAIDTNLSNKGAGFYSEKNKKKREFFLFLTPKPV